jgi:16S rRNA (guanine527-N7)-methyltransferase
VSYRELIEAELLTFQIELPISQRFALAAYCDELDRWNRRMNLTGLCGQSLVRRLVAEPVWIAQQLQLSGILVDIGSGNGSPAVPVCITRPVQRCHLVEPRIKRAAFLRHLTIALHLTTTAIHRARFEEIAPTLGPSDWITLQALGLTRELAAAMRVIARPTTTIVWITSGSVRPELTPRSVLTVPITGTRVFLFQLDLS